MADALPSATAFFGDSAPSAPPDMARAPAPLPSASDFFADTTPDPPASSPALDSFLSRHPIGHVLNAFGQGAKQAWGTEPLGLSPDTDGFLRKAGVFNDYTTGRTSIIKSLNEAVIRPAVMLGDLAQRSVGAVLGGAEQSIYETGKQAEKTGIGRAIGAQQLGETLAGGLEYAGQTGIPELHAAAPHAGPVDIAKARSLGVIGEDEAGYFGTKEPTPESAADRAEAVKQQVAEQPAQPAAEAAQPGEPAPATPEPGADPAAPEAPDIHAVARQIAPETFQEYDALSQRKDTFRRWITELDEKRQADAAAPHAEEIADLTGRLADPDTTPRLAKKYQARLDDIRDTIEQATEKGDSPDMARIRQELQKADYRQRDLAPDVAAAYRQAQERMPPESAVPDAEQPVQAVPAEPEPAAAHAPASGAPQVIPATEVEKAGAAEKPGVTTTPPQIAADVAKKLVNAGRPQEEADAAAQLVASHYEARAARFGGAKGNAYELYARDAPNIRVGGRQGVKELAQRGKTLDQAKRGAIDLNSARNTIRLFKDANASTFIHETGHQWLEELMADARDGQAPADLTKDAGTVRDWLGVKEGEEIPTRAHEKFARGFERYMMEGVAPSKELAGVFAKFKAWLTQIYQTVNRLRAPISDDIRDVFDRLVAKNPEKTTIAAERDIEGQADIHEKLAEQTPPEKADAVAETVRDDIDKIAETKTPEIYDELNPNGPRGRGIPAPDEGAAGGGDAAGPVAGENGIAAESGAQPAGGDEVAQEGGPVPGRAERGPTAEPTGANERFTNPESNLVDKAGNIRLDNLNTPEDVSAVIRETAAANDDFSAARRGVLSDAEVLDLADALGVNPAFVDGRKIGQAFNAEQVMAARKLLIKSATNVRDIMRRAANGTDAEVMAYAEAKARHVMIQEQVAGITAEAGRALRAFRKIEGSDEAKAVGDFLKDATGRTLNQLREEAKFGASLETPTQVSKYMDDLNKHPFKNVVLEYYINALISGPITHFRYSVGNALNALWTPLVQIPFGTAIGTGREAFGIGAEANRIYLGEAGAQLFAITKGSRDGWKAATEAFRTGMSPSLPGERFHMQVPGAIPGKIGEAIRLPGKSVSAIHSFFKSLRYEQNIQGLAYRTAMNEKLTGSAFANRISDLTMRPTPEMMDEAGHLLPEKMEAAHFENVEGATQNALKELYMSPTKYNSAMGALTRAIDHSLVAKVIVPFMKIGSQITRNAFLEQTPLGGLSKEIQDEFRKGGAAADFQSAKMAGGIALAGITVGLAAEDMATGDGPEDPRQRAVWLLNHRPNTIMIGDISIPYQGLGSLGMLMRFSANTYEVGHQIGHEDAGKLAVAFLEGATKSVLDENFMRGVKDALDAIYHPEEYGAAYVKGFATNWLPFSVGLSQVARTVDPYQREVSGEGFVQSIWDTAKRKIPFASESLFPRRDMFGEPIPNSGPLPDYATDPVVKAMEAVKIAPGKLTRKIRGIPLTDAQYDEYSMLAGRMAKLQLNSVVALPSFDQMPAAVRIELLHKAIASSREIARSNMMAQDPTIIQRAVQAKIDPLKDQEGDFSQSVPENAAY